MSTDFCCVGFICALFIPDRRFSSVPGDSFSYHSPPQTWDEVIEYGKILTVDQNGDGVPERWGLGRSMGSRRAVGGR